MQHRRTKSQTIEQALLANFLNTREERRRADTLEKIFRRELLELDDAGAQTQPGALILCISKSERTSFSRPNLVGVFGEATVSSWAEHLPRTPYRRVDVRGGEHPRPFGDEYSR